MIGQKLIDEAMTEIFEILMSDSVISEMIELAENLED